MGLWRPAEITRSSKLACFDWWPGLLPCGELVCFKKKDLLPFILCAHMHIDTLSTCSPSSSATLSRVISGGLSAGVAILKASWASLKIREEEWMFFWMASSTVPSLNISPVGNKRRANWDLEARRPHEQPFHLWVETCAGRTFSCSEHGWGQLALLRLQVSQSKPPRVSAWNYGDAVIRVADVPGARWRLQHWQSCEHRKQNLQLITGRDLALRLGLGPFSLSGRAT